MPKLKLLLTAVAIAIGFAGAATAEFKSERVFENSRGGTTTVQTESVRTSTGRTTIVTGTRSDGTGWTREVTTSRDPETGTWTRQGSGVTSGGATWSTEGQTVCNDGKCYRNGRYVGPQGGVSTWSGESTRTEPGVVEGKRSWTGARGRSGKSEWSWRRVRRSN